MHLKLPFNAALIKNISDTFFSSPPNSLQENQGTNSSYLCYYFGLLVPPRFDTSGACNYSQRSFSKQEKDSDQKAAFRL